MGVELTIEEPAWGGIAFNVIADRALAAAFKEMGLDAEFCELSLLACADAAIADLNAEFRGKPVATNVLSWPAYELGPEVEGGVPARPKADPTGEIVLGDIAIAYQTCAREAAAGRTDAAGHRAGRADPAHAAAASHLSGSSRGAWSSASGTPCAPWPRASEQC